MKLNYLFLLLLLFSCKTETTEDEVPKSEPLQESTIEELARSKVTAELGIVATENYTMSIYKAQLDDDGLGDAVIVVNRKEHTLKKAKDENKVAYQESVGYYGNFNHMFYYDSKTNSVTRKIAVPSNGLIPLKVKFENILTEAYQNFTIDVRIRESRYRNFYTVRNGVPALIFQCEIQNVDDDKNFTANHIKLDKGSYSLSKDIVIYKAKILNKLPENLSSDFEIETEPIGEEVYRFFYHPKFKKYYILED